MRILVAIANYGTKNLKYLQVLLSEYRRMPFKVDVVILSNEPKNLGKDIEVRVGLPASNPWSLPFGHKPLFAERAKDYDLFIYSEDDTPITERNLRAFLEAVSVLPKNEIPGFLRYETGGDGKRHISSAHGRYHWLPETVKKVGGDIYAQFTNAHSACYILTREQLDRSLASGGFLVPPYEGDYDMLCSAATDPYTRCGMTKVINISRLVEFLLPHLPNKYVGALGTEYSTFLAQVEALKEIAAGKRAPISALPKLQPPLTPPWFKNYYEPQSRELLDLVPKSARSVLSLAVGTGATECELVRRGLQVTAIPLDSVISVCAEAKGVEMVHCELSEAPRKLNGRRFDCLIVRNLLYLHKDPSPLLPAFSPLLADGGRLLVMEPNFGNVQTYGGRLLKRPGYHGLGSFERSRLTPVTVNGVRRWVKSAGLSVEEVVHIPDSAPSKKVQKLQALPPNFSSAEFVVAAKRQS